MILQKGESGQKMVKRLFLTVIKKWSKNGWRTKKNGRLKISNNEDADMHVAGRSNAEQKCAKVGGRASGARAGGPATDAVRAGGRTGGGQAAGGRLASQPKCSPEPSCADLLDAKCSPGPPRVESLDPRWGSTSSRVESEKSKWSKNCQKMFTK